MNAIFVFCDFVLKAEPAAPHREKRREAELLYIVDKGG